MHVNLSEIIFFTKIKRTTDGDIKCVPAVPIGLKCSLSYSKIPECALSWHNWSYTRISGPSPSDKIFGPAAGPSYRIE